MVSSSGLLYSTPQDAPELISECLLYTPLESMLISSHDHMFPPDHYQNASSGTGTIFHENIGPAGPFLPVKLVRPDQFSTQTKIPVT